MQNKKLLVIEFIISSLLWMTLIIIVNSVIGSLPTILGGVLAGFLGIIYISTLSWYIYIDGAPRNNIQFIFLQILPLVFIGLWFDIVTALIIVFTLILGIQTLLNLIRDINESASDHIRFRVKTAVLPHTKSIIIWLMLISSVFIYGNTLKTNPNGIYLDEYFLNNQIQAWIPILNQISPDLDPNTSVGLYISEQLKSQDLNLKNVNQDKIIQQQVEELSKRFDLALTPDTPITQALVNYGNKFITPWMSGPLWGAIVSLLVFLTLLPFVGIFQFLIKITIHLIKNFSIKTKLVKFSVKSTEKEILEL